MNKYIAIILLGIVTVVFAESSLKRDKDTLIKALKEKFDQYKKQQQSQKKLQENTKSDNQPLTIPHQKQHDKAANAIGLALLDVSKPKPKDEKKTEKDNDDDEMPEDKDDDDDNIKVELTTKKENQSQQKTEGTKKNVEASDDIKKAETAEENQKDNSADKEDEDEKKADSNGNKKQAEDEVEVEDKDKDEDEESDEDDDDKKSSKDADKEEGENPRKKLKDTVKELKESEKSLKDKNQQAVNVGQLKKLLATSVENLDKAGRAIQNLLQYDQRKKAHSRNTQVTPQPYQGYPQQGYGGYPQQQSPYQTTCPGQCSNLCAPSCRDPCCRFPPGIGMNTAPPVQARGSYQQGLINAYPPMTQLGGSQASYQPPGMGQGMGQQCGQQCSPQSCAPSCSASCCSSGGQTNPPCPTSCLNDCAPACHARCCVPGRK